MVIRANNPWENTTISDLVDIGTHKLNVSTSGPPRKVGEAVIIMFTGGGAPAKTYMKFHRLLSQRWRVYFPDRSGYDRSERGPDKVLTAQKAATEFVILFDQIQVKPPYVIIGHSYGGIVARAFLELQKDNVAGAFMADGGSELLYHMYHPHIPPTALQQVGAGVDVDELSNARVESGLTDEEWNDLVEAAERTQAAAKDEDNHGSAWRLAQCKQFEKQVMGDRPVSVVRCDLALLFRLLYKEGVRRGQGTAEQRREAEAFLNSLETFDDELRAAQLRLSSFSRYTSFPDRPHDDILRHPEDYVREVAWIMEHL